MRPSGRDSPRRIGLGRLEHFVRDGIEVLVDAAHNPAGARALASHLQDIGWTRVTLVFGAMRDKDVNAMLAVMAPACERIICTTAPSPRAMPASELADAARRFVSAVEVVPDFAEAAETGDRLQKACCRRRIHLFDRSAA